MESKFPYADSIENIQTYISDTLTNIPKCEMHITVKCININSHDRHKLITIDINLLKSQTLKYETKVMFLACPTLKKQHSRNLHYGS